MSITYHTSITVICDRCGLQYPLKFTGAYIERPDTILGRIWNDDWNTKPDGRIFCPECVEKTKEEEE